jgi:hypothetical protein
MTELNQSGQEYKCTDTHSNGKFPVEVQFKNEYLLIKIIYKLRVLQIIENKKRAAYRHPFFSDFECQLKV